MMMPNGEEDSIVPRVSKEFEGSQPWQERGSCFGLGTAADKIFFPERGGSVKQAKVLCRGCTVRNDCLTYALVNNINHGIWGGCSERERKQIRKGIRFGKAS